MTQILPGAPRRKRALVTAASQGIGKGIAGHLVRCGIDVVITSRDPVALENTASEIASTDHEGQVHWRAMDLENSTSVKSVIASLQADIGHFDIVIVNSGPIDHVPVAVASGSDWERAITNKFHSLLWIVECVLPQMREARQGCLLNIGAANTKEPVDGYFVTNSVRMMTSAYLKSLATEIAPDNVRVNQILCGYVDTTRLTRHFEQIARIKRVPVRDVVDEAQRAIPLGRLASVEEIASVAHFLVTETSSYITGQSIVVDGGLARQAF